MEWGMILTIFHVIQVSENTFTSISNYGHLKSNLKMHPTNVKEMANRDAIYNGQCYIVMSWHIRIGIFRYSRGFIFECQKAPCAVDFY